MNPFFALVLKDLKLFLQDRRAVIVTLAVPIAIGSFFGFVIGGQSGQPKRSGVSIQVVDLDDSAVSREIVTGLKNDPALKATISDEPTARRLVRTGKTALAVIIPKGFGDAAGQSLFAGGKKPVIDLPHDPSRNMETSMVKGILTQHVMQTVTKEMFGGAGGQKFMRQSLAQLETNSTGFPPALQDSLRQMLRSIDQWMEKSQTATNGSTTNAAAPGRGGMTMPFETNEEEVKSGGDGPAARYNGFAHSFGGMGVQFVLMAAIDFGIGILLERKGGIWKRLRSAPLSRFTLLGSRMMSSALIGSVTLLIVFGFSMVVFHVRIEGSITGFILCCAAIGLLASSLGLLIGSFGKTPQATRGIAIFVVLIMVMLGGAWIPSFIFPAWLQSATLVMPTRWAIDGLAAMTWRGLGFDAIVLPLVVLLGYSAIFIALALARFRWEDE
jgi:ABC-2 type transport system permease protein